MFTRNQLVHAVLWPSRPKASISLIDTDGVEVAKFPIDKPMLGSDLVRFLPADFHISMDNVYLATLSGRILIQTRLPFDTVVVTEKAAVSIEDRVARMERREQRRQRRFERDQAELRAFREAEANRQGPPEPELVVPDGEPSDPPLPEGGAE